MFTCDTVEIRCEDDKKHSPALARHTLSLLLSVMTTGPFYMTSMTLAMASAIKRRVLSFDALN